MKKLTHKQLVNRLSKRKGAIILGIVAETPLKLKATGNPFKTASRIVHRTVVTGANYTKAVERQGGKDFVSEGLPYGKFLVDNKVIEAPSGLQLRTVARNPRKPILEAFIADGAPVSRAAIASFLPSKRESVKQAESGVKGKKQVQVRNYSFSNIKEVHIDGERFQLVKS